MCLAQVPAAQPVWPHHRRSYRAPVVQGGEHLADARMLARHAASPRACASQWPCRATCSTCCVLEPQLGTKSTNPTDLKNTEPCTTPALQLLDKYVYPEAPTSTRAVLAKTAADQLLWAPGMTVVFFAFLKTLEGAPAMIIPTIQVRWRCLPSR